MKARWGSGCTRTVPGTAIAVPPFPWAGFRGGLNVFGRFEPVIY